MRSASPWEMMWWPHSPMFAPARSSCTSLSLTFDPFMEYSLAPSLNTARSMETSSKSSFGNIFFRLSKTIETAPLLERGVVWEPDQMRSSLLFPRMDFIDCSPRAKRNASATLLLPEPFGPTMAVVALEKSSSVFLANDLNPAISSRFSMFGIQYIRREYKRPRRERGLSS